VAVDFEADISWFIDRHFNRGDLASVYEVLEAGVFRTPRVTRAVLFLSNGSLSLLRHYARASVLDVRSVLVHAEYVAGVSEMPMQVRDMSLPLWHERNRGPESSESSVIRLGFAPYTPDRSREVASTPNHHPQLVGRRFKLGKIHYLVANRQSNNRRVRCFRKDRNAATLVELPLAFVVEQVAERIEITDTTY
jgi:hypothetical protein